MGAVGRHSSKSPLCKYPASREIYEAELGVCACADMLGPPLDAYCEGVHVLCSLVQGDVLLGRPGVAAISQGSLQGARLARLGRVQVRIDAQHYRPVGLVLLAHHRSCNAERKFYRSFLAYILVRAS